MRAVGMLMLLSLAGPCYAEDPLETLNTVEDTLIIMEAALHKAREAGLEERRIEPAEAESGARGGEEEVQGEGLRIVEE